MLRRIFTAVLIVAAACSGETPVGEGISGVEAGAPVILISIDTLRADHLPAYGYEGVKTPAIDALRGDGILYTNAWSHCPMTLPSHVSILTGLLPYEHGVRNNIGYRYDSAKHQSIAAMLRQKSYATGAAVSAYVVRGDTGLGRDFEFYDDRMRTTENVAAGDVSRPGGETVAAAMPWITQHASKPFFFMLHLFEPHSPYVGSYDSDIAAADAIVGRFLDQLRALDLYDRSTIILLSDHGEGLGDHGESEHGVFLYREALHVPLIIKLPRNEQRGLTIDAPVQLIDVAPTIAALAGLERNFAGTNLLDTIPEDRQIYSETLLPRIHFGWSELRSIVDARHQLIDAPAIELYDYVADPAETKNIAAEQRRTLAGLKASLATHEGSFTAPSAIDAEEAEKLAALGYIGQARTGGAQNLPDPKDVIGDLEELRRIASIEKSGDLRMAAAGYRGLAEKNPRFADAWLRLASLHERMGDREAAIESYRRALTAAPELASHLAVRIGTLYLESGRLEEAAAHARLALETSPGAAHHLLGRVALARRDYAAAAREAAAASEDIAYHRPAAILQALVFIEQGRLAEALRVLDDVRSKAGTTAVRDLELTRGDVLARMERAADAEKAFHSEIRSFPQNRQAYSKLALLYFATGRVDDGAAVLENMVAASPDRTSALLAAGVAEAVGQDRLAARWRAASRRETFSSGGRPTD